METVPEYNEPTWKILQKFHRFAYGIIGAGQYAHDTIYWSRAKATAECRKLNKREIKGKPYRMVNLFWLEQ